MTDHHWTACRLYTSTQATCSSEVEGVFADAGGGFAALPACLQLTVIGRIVNVIDRGSNLIINLTDGTGDMEVCYWLQEDSEHVSELSCERTWWRRSAAHALVCVLPSHTAQPLQQHMHMFTCPPVTLRNTGSRCTVGV